MGNESSSPSRPVIIGGILLVIAAAAGGWFYYQKLQDDDRQLKEIASSATIQRLIEAAVKAGEWPDDLNGFRKLFQGNFDEGIENPITGDRPGYEFVKPPIEYRSNANAILVYQLRDGTRDLTLPAGFADSSVRLIDANSIHIDQLPPEQRITDYDRLQGAWVVVAHTRADVFTRDQTDEGFLVRERQVSGQLCGYDLNDGATLNLDSRQKVLHCRVDRFNTIGGAYKFDGNQFELQPVGLNGSPTGEKLVYRKMDAAEYTARNESHDKLAELIYSVKGTENPWPDNLEGFRKHIESDFDEFIKNPLTGDKIGYEYVKPPFGLKELPDCVVLYQLRGGKRDLTLPVGFCTGDIEMAGESSFHPDKASVAETREYLTKVREMARVRESANRMRMILDSAMQREAMLKGWPKGLSDLRDTIPAQYFASFTENPLTRDRVGYELVDLPPRFQRNKDVVVVYQLRNGKRDLSLDVGFADGHIAKLDANSIHLDKLPAEARVSDQSRLAGRWQLIGRTDKSAPDASEEFVLDGARVKGRFCGQDLGDAGALRVDDQAKTLLVLFSADETDGKIKVGMVSASYKLEMDTLELQVLPTPLSKDEPAATYTYKRMAEPGLGEKPSTDG